MATPNKQELAQRADAIEVGAFADQYAAAPAALRAQLGLASLSIGGARALLAPGLPNPFFNRVIGLGVDSPADSAGIDGLLAAYREARVRTWWLHVSPFASPSDLERRLRARGFTDAARPRWAKMWRPPSPAAPAASGLDVHLTLGDEVRETAAAIAGAFGMPPFVGEWLAALYGRLGWRMYTLADASGMPTGGACLYVAGRDAWLGMAGIRAGARGQGGQRALMVRRIADAAALGCEAVFTETGEPVGTEPNPSYANMLRSGFTPIASRLNLAAPPA